MKSSEQYNMPLYELLHNIPCAKAGTIFYWDKFDKVKGSIAEGCLKMAWTKEGNAQNNLCADTIVFHANAKDDKCWFKKLNNETFKDYEYIVTSIKLADEDLYRRIER